MGLQDITVSCKTSGIIWTWNLFIEYDTNDLIFVLVCSVFVNPGLRTDSRALSIVGKQPTAHRLMPLTKYV